MLNEKRLDKKTKNEQRGMSKEDEAKESNKMGGEI